MNERFFTSQGLAVPAVSARQMRIIDRIAIEESGPNLFQMMENAGRSLALLAMQALNGQRTSLRYLVLAGKGGNGGGGICAARHLFNREMDVTVCTLSENLKKVPAFQRDVFERAGGRVRRFEEIQDQSFDVIIDAIFGYSLNGAPRGKAKEMIEWANEQSAFRIALDVPSGVEPTSGEIKGVCFNAGLTVTLALPKSGLSLANSGRLFLADLGIAKAVFRRANIRYVNPFGPAFYVELREKLRQGKGKKGLS